MARRICCFFLEPTGRVRVTLRRFTANAGPCPLDSSTYSFHDASQFLCEEPVETDSEGHQMNGLKAAPEHLDPRWPTHCKCSYAFQETDTWQRFTDDLFIRKDTGEEMTLRDAPAGAMWESEWMDRFQMPQGTHNLIVKTPGGDWCVDSQASNCTLPEDRRQERHHCWIRHGTAPDITVDKVGLTCGAGAGSILCGSYHGFLRGGYLED